MIWWILQNFIVTALLAGCVWAVCRLGRVGPVGRHALWLLLLVKLLTPPLVNWPWTVQDMLPASSAPAIAATSPVAPQGNVAAQIFASSPRAAAVPVVAHSPIVFSDWLLSALASIWFAGFTVFALMQAERIRWMLRLVRHAVPAGPELTSLVEEVARKLKVPAVETRIVDGIASPFIWCVHRPLLIWPAALSQDIPEESTRALLVHELAHLKRRDHWVGWLELLAGCLWWWNPLYWCIRHQLRENAELACDAWAVNEMDSFPRGRRVYAEALLSVCESISGEDRKSNPMPAVGVDTGNRRFLERRLTMIVRERLPFRLSRAGMLVIALIAATVLPMWTLKGTPTPPPPAAQAVRPGLPGDVQELLKQFESQQSEVRRNTEATIERQRQQTIQQLQALQDTYTKAGKLDEAVAVRNEVRRLQGAPPIVTDDGQAMLDRNVPQVNFTNTPLKKALEDLRDMANANIYVPWKMLGAFGIEESAPVNVKVRNVPLRRALSLVLNDATGDNRLTFDVDGGVIEVTTKDALMMRGVEGKFVELPGGFNVWPESLTFGNNLVSYRDAVGRTIQLPVTGQTIGPLWGTDVYTDDSDPNVAAVHAGLLRPGQHGLATIKILPGQNRYVGSSRNGVLSNPYEEFGGSYRFENVEPSSNKAGKNYDAIFGRFDESISKADRAIFRTDMQTGLTVSVPFELQIIEMRSKVGQSLDIIVTGTLEGIVWGNGVYTDDSTLGMAAVHAGLLKPGETGMIRVHVLPGRSRYEGSFQNGVRSQPYEEFGGSFRLERVK